MRTAEATLGDLRVICIQMASVVMGTAEISKGESVEYNEGQRHGKA